MREVVQCELAGRGEHACRSCQSCATDRKGTEEATRGTANAHELVCCSQLLRRGLEMCLLQNAGHRSHGCRRHVCWMEANACGCHTEVRWWCCVAWRSEMSEVNEAEALIKSIVLFG